MIEISRGRAPVFFLPLSYSPDFDGQARDHRVGLAPLRDPHSFPGSSFWVFSATGFLLYDFHRARLVRVSSGIFFRYYIATS